MSHEAQNNMFIFQWWAVWNCALFVLEKGSFYESASVANFPKTRNGKPQLIFLRTATANHSKIRFSRLCRDIFFSRTATAICSKMFSRLCCECCFKTSNSNSIKNWFPLLRIFSRTATAIHSKKWFLVFAVNLGRAATAISKKKKYSLCCDIFSPTATAMQWKKLISPRN